VYELVHRAVPKSTRLRAALSHLFGLGAATCLALIFVTGGLVVLMSAGVGLLFTALSLTLAAGLVEQAEAAPDDANPAWRPPVSAESDADPIETLKQRYAEGELTDEEFERRMERLMESDARTDERGGEDEHEREPAFER
jgi:uncharacterized membrane protein